MAVRIVRLGSARHTDEGIRLGTVRRPPRGVRKAHFARDDWFDSWLPNLSPSAKLMRETSIVHDRSAWTAFARRFRGELKRPDASHLLDALAAMSQTANFSVGCYCEDEAHCHRAILRSELASRGAKFAEP